MNTTTTNRNGKILIKMITMDCNGLEVEVPSNFICPISQKIMHQPMMTRTGLNFERSAICRWLANGIAECPVTGKSLSPSNLIANHHLKEQIEGWRIDKKIAQDDGHPTLRTTSTANSNTSNKVNFLETSSMKISDRSDSSKPSFKAGVLLTPSMKAMDRYNKSKSKGQGKQLRRWSGSGAFRTSFKKMYSSPCA